MFADVLVPRIRNAEVVSSILILSTIYKGSDDLRALFFA